MTRAVRFDQYGDVDVLRIDEVERPVPAADQVLVEVVAAGINPREAFDPARINTVIDYAAAQKAGAKIEGSSTASDAEILGFLAGELAWGRILLPIAAIYPLDAVRDAYTELAARHTRGKIVLATELPANAGRVS
jgi:NADPH:quinone reductase-like Zn-dependent oxidoreductase